MQELREKRQARPKDQNHITAVMPHNEPPSKGDLTANFSGFVVWLGAFLLLLFIVIVLSAA